MAPIADLIGAVPVIPAKAVAAVLETGTVTHAQVWHIANAGFVLAVSQRYHLAYTPITLRREP